MGDKLHELLVWCCSTERTGIQWSDIRLVRWIGIENWRSRQREKDNVMMLMFGSAIRSSTYVGTYIRAAQLVWQWAYSGVKAFHQNLH